ncbi:Long-chain-fatty-acid--CoA ligase [Fulvivirga imtechensis AK7]|uniref:Long-chain-fatty-acid--CoA ligase n=1 Tax=Fulvivirga imtechensis AK7 TaxID=1237149 RepID=L8JI12_9BACT|nr:non-ribosomal peptide synthetase [Fulvivirga imtechensis]ELR68460.1 Long-chain-fatty-acid--CoA ligase [Fulvivirga imtechensis AK7]
MAQNSLDEKILSTARKSIESREYWKNKLSNYSNEENIRLFAASGRRVECNHLLPINISDRIVQLCNNNDEAIYILLLSALAILESKYSGVDDIIIGMPPFQKNGEIVTTGGILPLRCIVDEDVTCKELILSVQKTVFGAQQHQHYKLNDSESQVDCDINSIFYSGSLHSLGYQKDYTAPLIMAIGRSQGQIMLEAEGYEDGFTLSLFIRHFINLIQQIVHDPAAKISSLDLLTREEIKVLVDHGQGQKLESPFESVIDRIRKHAVHRPDETAVVYNDVTLSFAQLHNYSDKIASYLISEHNIKRGDFVIFDGQRTEKLVPCLLGILKAGAVYVPLDGSGLTSRNKYIIKDISPCLVVTTEEIKELSLPVINVEASWEEIISNPVRELHGGTGPDDLAYVIYTSGSTGNPKGTMVTHRNLFHFISNVENTYNWDTSSVMPFIASPAFDISMFQIFGPLVSGGSILVLDKKDIIDIERLLDHLKMVNMLDTVPALYKEIADEIIENKLVAHYEHIKTIFIGGDTISDHLLQQLSVAFDKAEIVVTYGPTEATVFCTSITYSARDVRRNKPSGTILGRPLYNNHIYISNRRNNLVPVGVEGEVCIGGPGVAKGYFNKEDLSSEKFLNDPYNYSQMLYRTGDMGRLLPDGTLEFLGRRDNQIKIRGHRIEIGEIENKLLDIEGIKDVAVVSGDQQNKEKVLIAFYTGRRKDEAILKDFLTDLLPAYMIPSSILWREKIPLNSNGKIDRKALVSVWSRSKDQERSFVPPSNTTEKKLIEIWNDILEINQIGIEDNFFELGGHSLLAAKLAVKLHKETGVKVPLSEIFSRPTIKSIADFIQKSEQPGFDSIVKIELQEYYEVSHAQQRLWVLDQLEDQQVAYNITSTYLLKGEFKTDLLQQAFDQLLDRHEILRTTFVIIKGQLRQKVHPAGSFRIKADIEPMVIKDDAIEDIVQQELNEPFNLNQSEPLLRVRIYKLEENAHLLIFTVHHIVADGWSMQVLTSEVLEWYNIFYHGRTQDLAPLNIQYKDYAHWQNRLLGSKVLEESRKFWLNQFADELPVLHLPTDYSRPKIKTYHGACASMIMDRELTQKVNEAAVSRQATLFMFFLTAIKVLFYRYTGQTDIIIGYPVSGRDHIDLANQIGCYVNTQALRTKFSENDTFLMLLERIKETLQHSYDHQSYPFDRLIDELDLDRDLSRSPLFDIMVSLQNLQSTSLRQHEMEHVSIKPYQQNSVSSMFDLAIDIVPTDGILKVEAIYNTDLFRHERIEQMLSHLKLLINNIVEDETQPISLIDYVDEKEKEYLLSCAKGSVLEIAETKILPLIFEIRASEYPDNIAVAYDKDTFTYAQLYNKVLHHANYLTENCGCKKGDFVAMLLPVSPEAIAWIMAILRVGGVYVPIDVEYPPERIDYILRDAKPKIIIADNRWNNLLMPDDSNLIVINDYQEIKSEASTDDFSVGLNDLAYVLYTSGSTGAPKGVQIDHGALLRYTFGFNKYFNLGEGDCMIQQSSLSFDTSLEEIFPILIAGGRLVIVPEGGRNVEGLVDTIINNKVTLLSTTPLVINELNRIPESLSKSHLRCLISGGDELKASHIDHLVGQVPVFNSYGPTESTICATYCEVQSPDGVISIGKPFFDRTIYILDDYQQIVPQGVSGEICIGGGGLARGYLNSETLSQQKFISNPFGKGKLYRSGDLGRWNSNGMIEFLGRKDDQVKIRGYRIELVEIENAIKGFGGINNAVVAAKENAEAVKYLVAYYCSETKIDKKELRLFLLESLPSYMVPSFFIELDQIPVNANGKIDRKKLPVPTEQHSEVQAHVKPHGVVQETLADIWIKELGVSSPGIDDNFFESGGHSIKAIRMLAEIYQRLNVTLTLRDVFLTPTIRELGEKIRQLSEDGPKQVQKSSDRQYYDLSNAQKGLWIHTQIEKDLPIYNMSDAYIIEGRLNVTAFEGAFEAMIQRHESLRTVFIVEEGEPKQKIIDAADLAFKIDHVDLKRHPERDSKARELVEEELEFRFDLELGPLLKATLIQLEENKSVFVLTIHHIISDEWSMLLLTQEVIRLYAAFDQKDKNPLEPLPTQFRDFVALQNWELSGKRLDLHRNYWLTELSGELPVLELPYDRPRPVVKTYNGGAISLKLNDQVVSRLRNVCQINEASLFMGLFTGVELLLNKYTGDEDIIVGYPVSGRDYAGLENQIGLFVNTLALRLHFDPNDSFDDLLTIVKKKVINSFEHQLYPFDTLLDELGIKRDLSRTPLFDAMVIYQNVKDDILNDDGLKGIKIRDYKTRYNIARYDLSFYFTESVDGVHLSINYNTDLFEETTINRMLKHYDSLLANAVRHCKAPIKSLSYLDNDERDRIIHEFNNTSQPYPGDSVHKLFEDQVVKTPDLPAVVTDSVTLTYSELNQKTNRLAHYLRDKHHIRPNDFVAILLERSEHVIICILAILKAGAAYVPIDPRYPKERKKQVFDDARPKVLLTQSDFMLDCADYYTGELFVVDLQMDDLPEEYNNLKEQNCNSDLAYVMYTSGSTGEPKGVMVEHKSIARLVFNTNYFSFYKFDKLLLTGALSFDATTFEIWSMLLHGGELHIIPENRLLNISDFKHTLNKNAITTLWLTSSWFNQIVDTDKRTFDRLRYLIIGGDKLSPSHVLAIKESCPELTLVNGYGPTENTTFSACFVIDKVEYNNPVPIGKPISNSTVYILDSHLNLVPIGVKGGIYVGGEGVARGYLNKAELTAEKFIENPFKKGERLYNTGDLGKWDKNGNVIFLGRRDNQVKIRGFRIETGEIQNVIEKNKNVKQALVLAREDAETREKYLVAWYTAHNNFDAEELRLYASQFLPDYMVPSVFVKLDAFPLTVNGKINIRELPEPNVSAGASRAHYEPPQSETEKKLASIWENVLGQSNVGLNDDFFALGGHSLRAMQIISRISEKLNAKVDLNDVFTKTTVKALAEFIDSSKSNGLFIPKAPESDNYELSFGQKRLWAAAQLDKTQNAYNISSEWYITGGLNRHAFERAFNDLIDRHESLRTIFIPVDGEPRQKIQDRAAMGFKIEMHDLTEHLSPEAEALSLSQAQSQKPFDLETGPLLKVSLFLIERERYLFSFVIHHIIVDGWSLQVLMRDLVVLYKTHNGIQPDELPLLTFHYKDYVFWQNNLISATSDESPGNYWRNKLKGAQDLRLPSDFPEGRDNYKKIESQDLYFLINPAVTKKIRAFSNSYDSGIFPFLTAGLKVLLHHFSQQDDIILGSPGAGRKVSGTEDQVGFYLNMHLLRDQLDTSQSFRDFFRQVRTTIIEAIDYGAYPFELVAQELASSTISIEAIVDFHRFDIDLGNNAENTLEGLGFVPVAQERSKKDQQGKYNISFLFQELEDEVSLLIEFNTKKFRQSTVEDWAEALMMILEKASSDYEVSIEDLNKVLLNLRESKKKMKKQNRKQAKLDKLLQSDL